MNIGDGPLVVVDLSNLCRDRRLLPKRVAADLGLLDRFVESLQSTSILHGTLMCIADRSLPSLLDAGARRKLRDLESLRSLEFSSVADERLLNLAFGENARNDTLVASMDNFDDYRRIFPAIQGSTDRFIGWDVDESGALRVVRRDMGVHPHQLLSRKEESEELKARRLWRQSIVRQATETYFRCDNRRCLIAQLWPNRLPELPRFDDRSELFVCPSCGDALSVGEARVASSQLIVFLHGVEQTRLLLDEGQRMVIGRNDAKDCVGLEPRLGADTAATISRQHVAFTRTNTHVAVEELGSRNGTVLRWIDRSAPDEHLTVASPRVIGRRNAVALPSGITIEVSGRSIPFEGERAPDTGDADAYRYSTRILSSRR